MDKKKGINLMKNRITKWLNIDYRLDSQYGTIDYEQWCMKELPRLNAGTCFVHSLEYRLFTKDKEKKQCSIIRESALIKRRG